MTAEGALKVVNKAIGGEFLECLNCWNIFVFVGNIKVYLSVKTITVEPLLSGHPLSGHPLLSLLGGQLSKS